MAKISPRLRREPTLKRVEEIAEATPLREVGTEFIIAATFGATNMPPPAPARTMGSTREVYGAPTCVTENQRRATADTAMQLAAKRRGPNRSERYPLRGPRQTKD